MNNSHFDKVVADFNATEGYMDSGALGSWDALLTFQNTMKIEGDFFEIGAFRGKSATIMANHARANEKVTLVDSELEGNVMRETLARVDKIKPGTAIHVCRSDELTRHFDVDAAASSCRWIHIDGGHSMAAVINDLKIADTLLQHDGMICMDDFFAPHWPQVTAAVFRYLYTAATDLNLVLVGFNKGFLCRTSALKTYLRFMSDGLSEALNNRATPNTVAKTDYDPFINCFGVSGKIGDLDFIGVPDNY
tara:strand:+ start:148468 stop:149214 length:747 start_codon:yes stop_codon:yes gene_type:complete